jgi:hypothetical protein
VKKISNRNMSIGYCSVLLLKSICVSTCSNSLATFYCCFDSPAALLHLQRKEQKQPN